MVVHFEDLVNRVFPLLWRGFAFVLHLNCLELNCSLIYRLSVNDERVFKFAMQLLQDGMFILFTFFKDTSDCSLINLLKWFDTNQLVDDTASWQIGTKLLCVFNILAKLGLQLCCFGVICCCRHVQLHIVVIAIHKLSWQIACTFEHLDANIEFRRFTGFKASAD